jgi:Iron-containing redox enzyme
MSSSNRESLDQLVARERTWLDLTALRFLSHPALLRVFPEYLIGVYHSMRTAGALMEAARLRSIVLAPGCPVAERLVDYWTRHAEEEAGHDRWLLEDLPVVGIDCERDLTGPPIPEVAELLGTLHFWVLHTHPVAALPYFYIVERSTAKVPQLDWMVESRGIPRGALRTFYRHATIDIAHSRELEHLLDSLPLTAAHQELLAVSATTVVRQLARIMERHVHRADMLLAAGDPLAPRARQAATA